MKKSLLTVLISFSPCLAGAQGAESQQELTDLRQRIQRLEEAQRQQTQALTEEVANLKLSSAVPELTNQGFFGMGAGASKVYNAKSPLSIGGYGEIVYTDTQGAGNTTDAYRFVPYFGYRFSDKIIFNSELEFEHGGANVGAAKGESVIEFAYLDFLLAKYANLRVGHILVPVGLINLNHEPTAFPMVQRPDIEKNIIPSTWHENGVLFFGNAGGVNYTLGTVNSGYAGSFKDTTWMRSGRQKGAEAKAEDWSGVARVDWEGVPGVLLGASGYHGNQSQDVGGLGSSTATLWEAHTRLKFSGAELNALYTQGSLSDIEKIDAITGKNVGKEAGGYYTILSYDVLSAVGGKGEAALPVFVSYESYDLHKKVDSARTRNRALEKSAVAFGFNYRPVSNVTLKADYQIRKNKSADEADLLELGLGWVF